MPQPSERVGRCHVTPSTPPDPASQPPAAAPSGWRRLHEWLMPDYTPAASAYWWAVVVLGGAALLVSVWQLRALDGQQLSQVLVGIGLAMVAGAFPVRLPQVKNAFAAGEIFIFLLLLLFGPAASTLAAACESALGAYRTSRRWTSRIGSPCMVGLAMFTIGHVFDWALGMAAVRHQVEPGILVVATMVLGVAHFVVSTQLVTLVHRLKRREAWFSAQVMVDAFGWVGVAYGTSALMAAMLYLVYRVSGTGVLVGMSPLLVLLVASLHFMFRQQEAAELARKASATAAAGQAEQALRHMRELEASERRFHSAFTHASIGMALLAFDGCILQANPALRSLLGRREVDLVGQLFQDHVDRAERRDLQDQLDAIAQDRAEGFALELRCAHSDATQVWVALHCTHFSEPGAATPCLILQVQDVSARRRAEAGLQHQAFHDSLTGLPNRRRFHQLLSAAVAGSVGDSGTPFAVMFLDFDRFKLINDSLGHDAGDAFLVMVARRIHDGLRPKDIVARLGGDEFAVLVHDVHEAQQVLPLADRLLETLRQPYWVAGTELNSSASIGITLSTLGYHSPEQVLRDADIAMYKAKAAGKARYALFDSGLHTEVARRLKLEGDLRQALAASQLSLAYQGIYSLCDGTLKGFEALVRWDHPQEGPISPAVFLPIAEEAGLMVKLSDMVLGNACQQLAAWRAVGPTCRDLRMQVNLSSADVAHPAFEGRVLAALEHAGLPPQSLTLELTEHVLMSRLEAVLPVLHALRARGIGLAVDDFGTGYSSLSHLSTLPIDSLKIDRGFVSQQEPGSPTAAVVRSIVMLGASLGKAVVAEGVETAEQLQLLRSLGCAFGQGYLLCPPLSSTAATQRLALPLDPLWQPVALASQMPPVSSAPSWPTLPAKAPEHLGALATEPAT